MFINSLQKLVHCFVCSPQWTDKKNYYTKKVQYFPMWPTDAAKQRNIRLHVCMHHGAYDCLYRMQSAFKLYASNARPYGIKPTINPRNRVSFFSCCFYVAIFSRPSFGSTFFALLLLKSLVNACAYIYIAHSLSLLDDLLPFFALFCSAKCFNFSQFFGTHVSRALHTLTMIDA